MSAFRLPSGAFTITDQEVAAHLLETHFPGCQTISEPQSQSQPMTPSTENWLIASSMIRWAILGFGSNKTACVHGIFPGFFRLCSHSLAKSESNMRSFDNTSFESMVGAASEELDLKATFATVFQAEVYVVLACSDYCLRECMTGKTI
jgi:hypothetical protein